MSQVQPKKKKRVKPQKPQRIFKNDTPAYRTKMRRAYRGMLADCIRYMAGAFPNGQKQKSAFTPHDVSERFFGMNVAPSEDPAGDEIQVQTLRDLCVGAVRIDYGTHTDRAPTDRFIECLLAAEFPLTLHTVQDPDQASAMDTPEAQREWRDFLDNALERYGERIEALEVGSTPNRHSWSGYTPHDYTIASRIAQDAIRAWADRRGATRRPLLLGPNISDFAPYFTVGQLAACGRSGVCFDVMTDNLFIDRQGEPEQFDPHILGNMLAPVIGMDAVNKQKFLASIAARFGTLRSWNTYIHYTLDFGRTRERHVTEEQYINYMLRSHILTAAAGCFERCYWGTLVTHFKGLIDDALNIRPYPPCVHSRFTTLGDSTLWKRRENFIAPYATMAGLLAGSQFVRNWKVPAHVRALEFTTGDSTIVAAWTLNGRSHVLDLANSPLCRAADQALQRDGTIGPGGLKPTLSESPVYLRFT